jgi:hypothetical protein
MQRRSLMLAGAASLAALPLHASAETRSDAIYRGAFLLANDLTRWLLTEFHVDSDHLLGDGRVEMIADALAPFAVARALHETMLPLTPTAPYEDAHGHLVAAIEDLLSAESRIRRGLIELDDASITVGTDYLKAAVGKWQLAQDALPD